MAAAEEIFNPVDLEASSQKCNATFSDQQKQKILFVTGFTGIGSVLCCTVAVSVVLGLRLYKRFAYRLTMALYQVLASLPFMRYAVWYYLVSRASRIFRDELS